MGTMDEGKVLGKAKDEIDLLERHLRMLRITKDNQPIGIIRLSELLGIPKHKVRYSLRLLEQEELIAATPDGAVVTDRYDAFMEELGDSLDDLKERIDEVKEQIPH